MKKGIRMVRRRFKRNTRWMVRRYWQAMNASGWNMVGWEILWLRRLAYGLVCTAFTYTAIVALASFALFCN